MATVMVSSSSLLCPCGFPSSSSTTFSSSVTAAASSPSPNVSSIVTRGSGSRTILSSACSCRRQQRHQKPISGPLYVPPPRPSMRRKTILPCPRAELDQDTILAVGVGVAGIALGIGIPVFYETQMKGSETRENDQPCFPCAGSGSQKCRFCFGAGNITVELVAGEKEVSKCINCEGAGAITCTTCQGTGVQPRYLDRREFQDDD